ncbi:uncharacterized protein LOC124154497 [Ischnura elegans]|uniref:uncharacterized protein LOC124154056 n=1 Tax=Ischnura elegans TaxID=197161 RepID=UPI001ED8B4DD|nr:uncharacterized protein LOC124154056 [Ischnura elegans]XP_046384269.1 uncharacterized protein LOC124154497 [Ischnura elegans]
MEEEHNTCLEVKTEKKGSKEYCFVPMCTSTIKSTPDKVFVNVPIKPDLRKKWLLAARRDLKKMPLSASTHLRCCADHFNLEEDAENYMYWKMMGGPLRMKKTVTPHIFECQHRNSPISPDRPVLRKRKILELLQDHAEPKEVQNDLAIPINDNMETDEAYSSPVMQEDQIPSTSGAPSSAEKGIQARIKYRSKYVQTSGCSRTVATSPMKFEVKSVVLPTLENDLESVVYSSTSSENLDSSFHESVFSDSSDYSEDEESVMKGISIKRIMYYIERNPKLYLGIPSEGYAMICVLSDHIDVSPRHLMICLKKIKLNDSLQVLAHEFGSHYSSVSRILKSVLPLISKSVKELIFMPERDMRMRVLPMAFMARYSNVCGIVDCLEIAIEKPSDALHQAQTWSNYKKANTIKYLLSCLPSGFITFISEGYCGRASDEAITMDCGFLDTLEQGSIIMADRGFKNLERLVTAKGSSLVRPPSVSAGQKMSEHDAKMSKTVASLRIHVERAIGRIRDFSILKPSYVMDHNLVSYADHMITIACALVNIQSPLVKI